MTQMHSNDRALDLLKQRLAKEGLLRTSSDGPASFAPSVDGAPLAPEQQRFWLSHQVDPLSVLYNLTFAYRTAPLAADRVQRAAHRVLEEYPVLRTVYRNGSARLIPLDQAVQQDDLVRYIDLAGSPNIDDRIRECRDRVAGRPFDLETQLSLRVVQLACGDFDVLVLSVHHIAADGRGVDLIRDRLLGEIDGAPRSESAPVQYAAYARWRTRWLGSATDPESTRSKDLTYWSRRLEDVPPTVFPSNHDETGDGGGGIVRLQLDLATSDRIRRLATSHGASLLAVLNAAIHVALRQACGVTKVGVGTVVDGRSASADLTESVGCFTNTVVIESHSDDLPDFSELLNRCHDSIVSAIEHSATPFDEVAQAARRASGSTVPLFRMMIFHNQRAEVAGTVGHQPVIELDRHSHTALTDQIFGLISFEDGSLGLSLTYARARYTEDAAQVQLASILSVLVQAMVSPELRVDHFVDAFATSWPVEGEREPQADQQRIADAASHEVRRALVDVPVRDEAAVYGYLLRLVLGAPTVTVGSTRDPVAGVRVHVPSATTAVLRALRIVDSATNGAILRTVAEAQDAAASRVDLAEGRGLGVALTVRPDGSFRAALAAPKALLDARSWEVLTARAAHDEAGPITGGYPVDLLPELDAAAADAVADRWWDRAEAYEQGDTGWWRSGASERSASSPAPQDDTYPDWSVVVAAVAVILSEHTGGVVLVEVRASIGDPGLLGFTQVTTPLFIDLDHCRTIADSVAEVRRACTVDDVAAPGRLPATFGYLHSVRTDTLGAFDDWPEVPVTIVVGADPLSERGTTALSVEVSARGAVVLGSRHAQLDPDEIIAQLPDLIEQAESSARTGKHMVRHPVHLADGSRSARSDRAGTTSASHRHRSGSLLEYQVRIRDDRWPDGRGGTRNGFAATDGASVGRCR